MLDWINSFGLSKMFLPEDWLGRYEGKKIIVAGGGACVWDDLQRLGYRSDHPQWHVMAINDLIMHFPGPMEHAYSNDYKMLPKWIAARRPNYVRLYGPPHAHSTGPHGTRWPWPGHGTSALNAVYTALALGYRRVVLCGVPLDNGPHYWQAPWEECNFTREVGIKTNGDMMYWQNAKEKIFKGHVKSMSGRTRDLLG